MGSKLPPGSPDGTPWTPAAPSAAVIIPVQTYVVLVDWWLERVDGEMGKIRVAGITHTDTIRMREGAFSSNGTRKGAHRVLRSAAIVRRHDMFKIETEDGFFLQIARPLNRARTRENGFSDEVCESFMFGFPFQWLKVVNPNMEPENEPVRPTATPTHSVEYYLEKLESGCFTSLYPFTGDELKDTGVHAIPSCEGLCNGGMARPKKPLAPPVETCSSDQHESMQIDALGKERVNFSRSSVSVLQNTGPVCSNSKVVHNVSTPTKIVLVEKENYRSRAGCVQAEQDADIQLENRHSSSSEQEMVASPICETPKCGKTSANLGTVDAPEVPTGVMTPETGAARGLENNRFKILRSGKVVGMPSSAPMKRDNKRKRMQAGII